MQRKEGITARSVSEGIEPDVTLAGVARYLKVSRTSHAERGWLGKEDAGNSGDIAWSSAVVN
jgi:hypothetical protein